MYLERPDHKDFDRWLTELPQGELEYMIGVVNRESPDQAEERGDLAHVIALMMHFSDKDALSVDEIITLSMPFAVCLGLEIMLRQGKVTKVGKYSLIPDASIAAMFAMTEEEKQREPQE